MEQNLNKCLVSALYTHVRVKGYFKAHIFGGRFVFHSVFLFISDLTVKALKNEEQYHLLSANSMVLGM